MKIRHSMVMAFVMTEIIMSNVIGMEVIVVGSLLTHIIVENANV